MTKSRHVEPSEESAVTADWVNDETARWLDIEGASPEELRAVLSPLNLHPLFLENSLEVPNGPRVTSYKKGVYLHMPYFFRHSDMESSYVTMLCLPSALITIHPEATAGFDGFVKEAAEEVQLVSGSVQALFYKLIETMVVGGVPLWHETRSRIGTLTDSIDKKSSSVVGGEILRCKRLADRLCVICEDQLFCVSSLRSIESPAFKSSELQDYFRDLADDLSSAQLSYSRLEGRVRDIHEHYHISLQDVTNKRLNILAILSAIYLPSTLIAGIYGMNFEYVPIQGYRHGYYIILLIMISLVAGQMFFFWKKGWFK